MTRSLLGLALALIIGIAPLFSADESGPWIGISFRVERVIDGNILAMRKTFISSSQDEAWREIMPKKDQLFLVAKHPGAATAADGDELSGVLRFTGVQEFESGDRLRAYEFVRAAD